MAKFRTLAAVDRQAIDPSAKSEIVEIGETVELTDAGTIEKYVGNGTLEAIADTPVATTSDPDATESGT